ncbi:serine/threonine protein kinase [Saccharothrix tamanrassetensis]|uniref:non-specific serine/threonine protein kinase n=1 Tax=Saccharothrix tamanrassetensis TaxID=1051531 RepID=A0A841CUV0_9PSEU|nr:serine/threonine-protein kinase [Saccharothrix tamanrassetensis]MBB5960094.1 serine/threonine protein kinase [Saccharothrix tamanrassetensis]
MEERTVASRYRLTDRIGAGGMGVVWRAEDTRLRRIVAVKEVLNPNGFDADSARRAVREGRIAARLQHPNVIALYDVVEDEGRPWLVMEYLPSRSLASILADRGTLPPDEVARIGRQLAAGLAAAHEAGVVHRDVKPGNVLVTEFGTVKVTDFGTSRVAGEGTLTGSGLLVGTPAYLAPEVARGGEVGFPADVYGVGASLYAALEGTPPFGLDGNPIVLLHRAAEGKYPPPKNAGSLEPVLTLLLDPEPDNRPSMAEAVRMLTEDSTDPATVFASALPVAAATRIVVPPAPPADPPEPAQSDPQPDPRSDPQADPQADPPPEPPVEAPPGQAPVADAPPAPAADVPPAQAPAPDHPSADGPSGADRTTAVVPPVADEADSQTRADRTTAVVPPVDGRPHRPTAATLPAAPPVSPSPTDTSAADTPAHTPPPPADDPSDSPEAKRKRLVLLGVAMVAVVGVVVLVLVLNRDNGRSPSDQASDTGTLQTTTTAEQTAGENPPTAPSPTTGEQATTATTTPPTTTPVTTSAPPQPVGPDQALIAYYSLLPGDTRAGYARLTDAFKAAKAGSLADYQQFWSDKTARVSNVQANGEQVTATVTYTFTNGGVQQEQHRYTLVRVGDGWAIDTQVTIG